MILINTRKKKTIFTSSLTKINGAVTLIIFMRKKIFLIKI